MPNELSEKVYPDGTVVKLRDDTARELLTSFLSVVRASDQRFNITAPYTDITFTKPSAEGYTFYLMAVFAFTGSDPVNTSNFQPREGVCRVYSSTSLSNIAFSTQWLKVKNN